MSAAVKRVALVGMGKMGRVLEELAPERGWEVVARIHSDENVNGKGITRESLGGATVAIDFTIPAAAVDNVKAAVNAGCPIVIGTTGWYDALPELTDWVKKQNGAMLTAPNFSIGVNAFERIVALAGKIRRSAPPPGFDVHLVETHHAAKKDAPSGTALKLAKAIANASGQTTAITSVRTGFVPGTHELVFDAPFETIRLTHVARDRRVFAEGA